MKNFIYCLAALLLGCNFQSKKADLILFNAGGIVSNNSFHPNYTAVTILDGKIQDFGPERAILNQYRSKHKEDLKGAIIYPGFHDAHCHFMGLASNYFRADLKGTRSAEEVIQKLKAFEAENPEKTWITGRGYDQTLWATGEPHRQLLDEAFPNKPVALWRVDGHAMWANSKALELAGFTTETQIHGGILATDNNGLTGLLLERAGEVLSEHFPKESEAEIQKAVLRAQDHCFRNGLTHLTDAGLDWASIQILEQMAQEGQLQIGLNIMLANDGKTPQKFMANPIPPSTNFQVRSLKVYGDGSLGSRSACLKDGYADQAEHFGYAVLSTDSIRTIAEWCLENGIQMNVHAIGDSTIAQFLGVYAQLLPSGNDYRWRLEHSQVVDSTDYQLFREYNIIPSVQPTHATSDRRWAHERVGQENKGKLYPYKSLHAILGFLPLGTDFPVEGVSPLNTFKSAVFRRNASNEPPYLMEEGLDAEQTLFGMTIAGALGAFLENDLGDIQKGMQADFTLLNANLLQVQEEQFESVEVIGTIKKGSPVYQNW